MVRMETIADLLEAQQWATCADLAAQALYSSEITNEQKAFLNYARCRSLSNLANYSLALEPGQLAVYLAGEIQDYDLLGKALLELAWVQSKIPGLEQNAVMTQRRFFEHFPRFKTIRDRYLAAQYNLGVYQRGAGQFEDAYGQFTKVAEESKVRGDEQQAFLARNSAVWEALRLGRLIEAERLITRVTENVLQDPLSHARHLIDLAQLSILKGKHLSACGYAFRAVTLCEKSKELCAVALELLNRVSDRLGDPEAALVTALLAKYKAEAEDRHDIAAQARSAIRSLALRYPEAVERLMATIDGPAM